MVYAVAVADTMPADKTLLHREVDEMGEHGSLTITANGHGYDVVEKRIVKLREMTPEQRRLTLALVAAFGTCSLRIISAPGNDDRLVPDRVEYAKLRRG